MFGDANVSTLDTSMPPDIAFLRGFALIVTLFLTVVDTWSPHCAAGGHHHKVWLYAAVMMLLSGVMLMGVPHLVSGLFDSVSGGLVDPTLPADVQTP